MTEKKATPSGSGRRRSTRNPGAKSAKTRQSTATPPEPVADDTAMAVAIPRGQADNTSFDIGDSLTIREVEQMHERLSALLEQSGVQTLNGGEIDSIDAAGLQLLGVFMQEVDSRALEIGWGAASDTLCQAAQQLGLTALLQLDDVQQAA